MKCGYVFSVFSRPTRIVPQVVLKNGALFSGTSKSRSVVILRERLKDYTVEHLCAMLPRLDKPLDHVLTCSRRRFKSLQKSLAVALRKTYNFMRFDDSKCFIMRRA